MLIIDLDLQFGDVGLCLGLPPEKTMYDLAISGGSLDEDKLSRLRHDPRHRRRRAARAGAARPGERDHHRAPPRRPRRRAGGYDFVIADTPPGFTAEVIATIDASSDLVMVGTLDSLSLKNTKLGLETLGLMDYDTKKIQLVLNRADTRVGISQHDVVAVLGSEPNVFIPSDREIPRSVNEGIPIMLSRPQSYAAASFHDLAGLFVSATRHRTAPSRSGRERRSVGACAASPGPCSASEGSSAWNSTSVSSRRSLRRPRQLQQKEPFADLKNSIHMLVISELGPQLTGQTLDPVGMRDRVIADIRRHLSGETGIARDDRERLTNEIADDILGYGPLERLLADDSITEIMVNGPGEIWIERQGRLYETTVRFSDDSHLRRIINRMVAQIGRRIDESSPMVDARLPDGSRVNAIIAPLSLSGPLLTIRKFSRKRLGLQDMVNIGSLSEESVDFLRRCIMAQLNVLISGGTGSGKTTLLNALSSAIPDNERIVTIEDAAELQLHQRHVLRLEARPPNIEGEGAIPIRDLVRNSLRMRPDRIIVGECRGPEALDMLQAMNTGHDGSLSTVHANAPRDALARIETMVLMAGYDLPVRAIRQQVSSALDMIVHIERMEDGSRRVTAVTEVQRMESDVITMQDIFEFKIDSFAPDGTINGGLRSTGLRPVFLDKFAKRGIELPAGLFSHRPVADERRGPPPVSRCAHLIVAGLARRSRGDRRRASRLAADDQERSQVVEAGNRALPRPRVRPDAAASRASSALTTDDVKVTEDGKPGGEPQRPLVGLGGRASAPCS